MRSVLFLLMLIFRQAELVFLCPPSCLICSEHVITCQKLTSIIGAPSSIKALILTDGLIQSVNSTILSDLSNMMLLVLSHNSITSVMEKAFQNLTFLTTLSLDHNQISSQTLKSSTFSWLNTLETLHLGNNYLTDIHGSWFQSSSALKTLLLDGNLLTNLNSSTFAQSDLRNLETLDLSDNLLVYLSRDSFQALPHLRSLDLSRNHLRSTPDAFSNLPRLSALNLEMNPWRCTCELRELASFLRGFNQGPSGELYNGQKILCVDAENSSVQTVPEITDSNCVPLNDNIPAEIMTRRSVTSQQDLRNFAVAIVFSFLGGVAMTLGVIGIAYHKLSRKMKLLQEERGSGERSTFSPETVQFKFSEGKDTLSMSHALYNTNHKSHPSPPDLKNHFTCQRCSSTRLIMERANHLPENHPLSMLQQSVKDTSLERHKDSPDSHLSGPNPASQHHMATDRVSSVRIQQLALTNHFSALQRETFRHPHQIHKEETPGNFQTETTKAQSAYQTISCLHCHETFECRRAEKNQKFPFTDSSLNQSRPQLYDAQLYRDILTGRKLGFKLASQRSVTFDLPRPEEKTTATDRRKKETKMKSDKSMLKSSADTHKRTKAPLKANGQNNKILRVKFNLNPLRKNRVHPKSKDEESKDKKKEEKARCKKGLTKTSRKDGKKTSSASKDSIDGKRHVEESDFHKSRQSLEDVAEDNQPEVETSEKPQLESVPPLELSLPLPPPPEEQNVLTAENAGLDLSDALTFASNTTLPLTSNVQDVVEEPEPSDPGSSMVPVIQEYLTSAEGSTKRKLRLILPENPSTQRPQTALDKKIR